MATPVKGVESIEIFPISADGSMPTTGGTRIYDIQDESVTFDVPALETIKIRVEDVSGVRYVLPGDTDGVTFAANSINISGPVIAMLTGGIWTPGAVGKEDFGSFAAPVNQDVVHLAIKFVSQPFMGKKFELNIPVAAAVFNFAGAFTRGDFVAIGFTGEATTPMNEAGEAQSPWGYRIVEVLPAG